MSKTIEKALIVVDAVAAQPLSLEELTISAALPKSTAHRIATFLTRRGLLAYDGHYYSLGLRFLELGEAVKQQLSLVELAIAPMDDLARQTGETVHLGTLTGSDVIYLHKVQGTRGLQMASHVGLRIPFQFTALGKAILAFQGKSAWSAVTLSETPRTPQSIVTRTALVRELESTLARGYAIDREENELGIQCLAAPVFDVSGVAAAISITVAVFYITPSRESDLVTSLLACTRELSRKLGGVLPS